jgi:hypothetical protein
VADVEELGPPPVDVHALTAARRDREFGGCVDGAAPVPVFEDDLAVAAGVAGVGGAGLEADERAAATDLFEQFGAELVGDGDDVDAFAVEMQREDRGDDRLVRRDVVGVDGDGGGDLAGVVAEEHRAEQRYLGLRVVREWRVGARAVTGSGRVARRFGVDGQPAAPVCCIYDGPPARGCAFPATPSTVAGSSAFCGHNGRSARCVRSVFASEPSLCE